MKCQHKLLLFFKAKCIFFKAKCPSENSRGLCSILLPFFLVPCRTASSLARWIELLLIPLLVQGEKLAYHKPLQLEWTQGILLRVLQHRIFPLCGSGWYEVVRLRAAFVMINESEISRDHCWTPEDGANQEETDPGDDAWVPNQAGSEPWLLLDYSTKWANDLNHSFKILV